MKRFVKYKWHKSVNGPKSHDEINLNKTEGVDVY